MAEPPLLDAGEVVALRGAAERAPDLESDRPQDLLRETERFGSHVVATATAFLTGAECPFRCVYCDLWRYTLRGATPPGSIVTQVQWTMEELRGRDGRPVVHTLKLYNASNFFDERAVPSADDTRLLASLQDLERVVVECHPRLLLSNRGAARAQRYVEELGALEIALGLETAAPAGLEQIGKGAGLRDFALAFDAARGMGATTRAFVLYGVPRRNAAELEAELQRRWTLDTVRWAREAGASAVSIIPVRGGNGAMEELARRGLWLRPTLADFLSAAEAAMELEREGFDVFIDCWDLETFSEGRDAAADARRIERLLELDRKGRAALPGNTTNAQAGPDEAR